MILTRLIISIALAVLSVASMAQSQDLMGFERASFGSVVLSRTQAVGTGRQLELSIGDYENEPISNYKGTIFADIGKSVGRLDVLTDKGLFPCTAFIVSKQHILTNYHCSLGLLDDENIGATRIDGSKFLAGYIQTGVDEGTKQYTVIPTPVEFSVELDYAVLEVIGNPSLEYGKLKLASLDPTDRAPFWIIGHPQGKGQHISREKCRASTPAVSRNTLLHTCDTLPGNSGSPVIDAGLQVVVALHHAGIANDSVNSAILMSKILEHSEILAAYKPPEQVPKSQMVEPKTTAISACDALYSEAKEAKACYAYNVYINSCPAHRLVPMARGYVKEFCQKQELVKVDKAHLSTCDNDLTLCNNDELCGQSLTFESGKAEWRTDSVNYVAEAIRRGLKCGVNTTSAIETVFKNQSVLKRKQIQYALKELNYYRSNIDALYGPGTKRALTSYATNAGLIDNNPEILFSSLLEKVLVPSSFSLAKPKKNTCANNIKLCNKNTICSRATRLQGGQLDWFAKGRFRKYVTEANRRELNCGVNDSKEIKKEDVKTTPRGTTFEKDILGKALEPVFKEVDNVLDTLATDIICLLGCKSKGRKD